MSIGYTGSDSSGSAKKPDYKLSELTSLLNQPEPPMAEITALWISQFDRADLRADRAVMRILLNTLDRFKDAVARDTLPLQLEVYHTYGLGIITNSDGKIEDAIEIFERGLQLLDSFTNAETARSGSTAWILEQPPLDFLASLLKIRLGLAWFSHDKSKTIQDLFESSLATLESLKYSEENPAIRRAEGMARLGLSSLDLQRAQVEQALENVQAALAIFVSIGDRLKEADALNRLAMVYNYQNRYDEALVCIERCIAIRSAMDNRRDLGATYLSQQEIYYRQGRHKEAIEAGQIALPLLESTKRTSTLITAYCNLAISCYEAGRFKEGLEYATKSSELAEKIGLGATFSTMITLAVVAKNAAALGNISLAFQKVEEIQKFAATLEDSTNILRIGVLYSHLGQALLQVAETEFEYRQALGYFNGSVDAFKQMNDRDTQLRVAEVFARLVLSRPSQMRQPAAREIASDILERWLDLLQAYPEAVTVANLPQLLTCADWLAQAGQRDRSYLVYTKYIIPHLERPTTEAGWLERADLNLKIAEVTPPGGNIIQKRYWLEKGLEALREGNAPPAQQKEVARLLKKER